MSIKVIAKEKGYFNGEVIKQGTVLTIKGDVVPSWAKKLSQKTAPQTTTPQTPSVQNNNQNEQTGSKDEQNTQQGEPLPPQGEENAQPQNDADKTPNTQEDELAGKSKEELELILDSLLTQGIEKNIYLENTDKPIIEQIKEMREALKKTAEKFSEGE